MIQTKSVYDPIEDSDGIRVLITRYWPRGKTWDDLKIDLHVSDLAPSKKLIRYSKNRSEDISISWEVFEDLFTTELYTNYHAGRWINLLARLSAYFTVTLLCYEPVGQNCHRYLIKNLIWDRYWTYYRVPEEEE